MLETKVEYSIKAEHIDDYGHLDNKKYFDYLEDARHDWQERLGISDEQLIARGIGLWISKREIEHRKPVKDAIKIVTTINEFKGPVIKIEQEVYNLDGELCAICLTRQGFVDLEREQTIKPPKGIVEKITEGLR